MNPTFPVVIAFLRCELSRVLGDNDRCSTDKTRTIEPEATRKARMAALSEEIDAIHYANELYWRQTNPSDLAKAEYYRRQDRLEEIRSELAELPKA